MTHTCKATANDRIVATHSHRDFCSFIANFFAYKNARNVLALNNKILIFPARWMFTYYIMGFKFFDLFLRREMTCACC